MIKKFSEEFSNKINRLFPEDPKKLVRTITFQVTQRCSLRCTYCYQSQELHAHGCIMTFDIAKKFIDMILSYKDDNDCSYINFNNTKGIIIEFIGGEPLLEIDLIDKITDYFINRLIEMHHPWINRYMISICSNGTEYFNNKVQKYFKKHKNHISFSITIDGNKELHDACRKFPNGKGSYDIAMAAVNDWRSKGNYIGSKITLAPENIRYTYEAIKSLIENGYQEINANCVFEEGWTEEHAKILYNEMKKISDYILDNNLEDLVEISLYNENLFKPLPEEDNQNYCGGAGDHLAMLSVDYKGDIYPCIRYMESSIQGKQDPVIIGNVNTGIAKKKCEICHIKQLKNVTRRSQSSDECWYCPIASGCATCSAYNYQVFGTADKRATFICIMHKARALANVYYWNKLYKKQGLNKIFENHLAIEDALKIISKEELELLQAFYS